MCCKIVRLRHRYDLLILTIHTYMIEAAVSLNLGGIIFVVLEDTAKSRISPYLIRNSFKPSQLRRVRLFLAFCYRWQNSFF